MAGKGVGSSCFCVDFCDCSLDTNGVLKTKKNTGHLLDQMRSILDKWSVTDRNLNTTLSGILISMFT